MSLLKNHEQPDNIILIDALTVKLAKHISLNNIKKFLIKEVLALYKKNNLTAAPDDDFDTGIWFVSDYIYERLLTGAFKNFKKNGFLYFDPVKFADSILNSFTSKLAECLKIRGYSNSYIISDFNNLFVEFSSSNMSKGLVVNIYKEMNDVFLEIIILKCQDESASKRSVN